MKVKLVFLKVFAVLWVIPFVLSWRKQHSLFANLNSLVDAAMVFLDIGFAVAPGLYALWWRKRLLNQPTSPKKEIFRACILIVLTALQIYLAYDLMSYYAERGRYADAFKELQVSAVQLVDPGELGCLYNDEVCIEFVPPAKIAVGQEFNANGQAYKINIIRCMPFKKVGQLNEIEKDQEEAIFAILKVTDKDLHCIAAQDSTDLDFVSNNRVYLRIARAHLVEGER